MKEGNRSDSSFSLCILLQGGGGEVEGEGDIEGGGGGEIDEEGDKVRDESHRCS